MKRISIVLVAAVMILAAVVMTTTLGGCLKPPAGTVFVDLDGDLRADALARDADGDGQPDLDEEGRPQIVAGSEGYAIAEKIDSSVPEILMLAGGAIGVPVLVGVGAAWKGSRWGRIFMNTVMSIQAARRTLKESGPSGALEILDAHLREVQTPETEAAVTAAKRKAGSEPVTVQARNVLTADG